jgi:hypothetical protein
MGKSLFVDIAKLPNIAKSAISDCAAIMKDFQNRYLALKNVKEISEKYVFLNF